MFREIFTGLRVFSQVFMGLNNVAGCFILGVGRRVPAPSDAAGEDRVLIGAG